MGFEGYKFKHKLVVLQKLRDAQDPAASHAKNFEMVLYISPIQQKFFRFDQMESITNLTLAPYRAKNLSEVPPFDETEPTLENIGNVFYQLLKEEFAKKKANLERFELSETPLMTVIVNDTNVDRKLMVGAKKIKLANLVLGNVISQSSADIVSDIEEEEQTVIDVVFAPEPIEEAEAPKPKAKVVIPKECLVIPEREASWRSLFIAAFCVVAIGAILALYLKNTGAYPSGSDTFGHLFKSDLLYHSILKGDFYPLYTEFWYNGVQPFRYWAPFPYYFLAILQLVSGGDAVNSYYLFMFVSFVIGGFGWLLWGKAYNRIPFCTFLAIAWFFLPDNIRVFFSEGNLPRMVIAMLLPYILYFVWDFVEHRKKSAIFFVSGLMLIAILCHVMISAMIGITTFLFLLFYSISQKRVKESIFVIVVMLLTFALAGFWLYPALQGGLIGMDPSATADVMEALSTPVLISLDPFLRSKGGFELFYFGLSIFGISLVGLFLANKKSLPGFYTVLLVFAGTTTAMVTFLQKIPLNQLLWMTRFTPIVYSVFLLSLLEWRKCKRYAVILIALVLIVDCLPSVDIQRYHSQTPYSTAESFSMAKGITEQRLSLLDVSILGSYPSFVIASEEPKTQYSFGWAWQGATTAHNIVMVNTALERGYYHYLFDRSLELGDDTIMIYKELVTKAKKTLKDVVEAADTLGYTLYKETNYTYVFHRDVPKNFGVIGECTAISIGKSANLITVMYPSFEEGRSDSLTDYTFKDLSRYKVIFLSGFTYKDRALAEDLLINLSKAGVKVIVDMNRIPVDPLTSRMKFLDVTAQSISFSQRYPELVYQDQLYNAIPFKKEYSTWNTVYLENVDQVMGYSWFKNKKLPFLGYSNNENLIFMGYNFLFHAMETGDESITELISNLLEIQPNQLPKREIVPLTIEYGKDRIFIESPGGRVNTTIAFHDNFRSEQKIDSKNNLLIVEEPYTEIEIVYPFLFQGIVLSGFGLLGIAFVVFIIYRKRGARIEEKTD
ncbi:MAG: 6-pyruvoyl-tetrahydropterin synthase-related protein [Eubacteriales bacterium]|nr:6-pyruvoyl-tetrahydropterin synthase-related protein [Eubacteriales bacterium]